MKYLKRFNEELKASTYRSAGEKHQREGSKRRAAVLLDYADKVELMEKAKELSKAQKENKEFGLFDITMTRGWGDNKRDVFSGKFYLQMCLESDWFRDQRSDWVCEGMDWSMGIAMEFAIIPADIETLKMLETSEDGDIEYFRNNSMWGDDYRYWTNRLWFTVCDKFTPINTYNEKVGVKLNSELKSTIEELLIDLRHEEFETKVSEIDYHSQKERVKVVVSKDREFTYGDIKTQIEEVWSYLNGEGFEIEHFTCTEDWQNFEEPEDEFTIQQKDKGYVWGTDPNTFKVTSIEKEFQRRPEISKTEIYDPVTFDRVYKFTFEISFTKDTIVVDKTRGYLSTNEELKPQTYISAADKLKKMNEFEDRDGYKFLFNSRSDAMKFKTLLANTLEGKSNWGSWNGRTITDQLKQTIILDEEDWRKLLMDVFLPGRENEYDINDPDTWPKNPFTEEAHKRVVESVKKMSVNGLYKQDERPEQLKAWAETIRQREVEATHKRALEEAKKLGQFQLRFSGRGSEIRFANCYIQLYFNSDYYLSEQLPEWFDGDRNTLWSQFMFGVHPVSEEDLEVLDWFSGGIKDYTNRANGIIWLQDIYINLTTQNYKDEDGVKLPLTPSGRISIEGAEFSEVYFANRREAIKFRNLLVALFEGDIEYNQANGKDFKEEILETWCENDERPVELSELEDFIDKLRMTRLNSLYRD